MERAWRFEETGFLIPLLLLTSFVTCRLSDLSGLRLSDLSGLVASSVNGSYNISFHSGCNND